MAQIRPKILVHFGRQNQQIRVPINDLLIDKIRTFLTADGASGSGTLTVKNITGFAINQVLLIGEPGNEGSEIIKTHASSAPSGSTITLASNTVFPHSANTNIYVLLYDQVEFSTATTTTGSKSVLATSNLAADAADTLYNDSAASAGYYFARFKNTITSGFSSYSDYAPVTGYTILTARSIIDKALSGINKKTSDILSDEFFFSELNDFQTDVLREMERWNFMDSFNTDIGNTATGTWRVALPADCDDQHTNRSIYNFRIGTLPDLVWVDKSKWDELTESVAWTTLAVAILVNDATVTLTNSGDFPDAGTIFIGSHTYGYTANNRTTNVLTLTVVSTTADSLGADVFTGASFGMPLYWTTYGGYIYNYPVTGASFTQRNYYLDYYKSLVSIATDSDSIVVPDPVMAKEYLQWKALLKINNGTENDGSLGHKNDYLSRLTRLKNKQVLGRTFKLKPRFNDWSRLESGLSNDDSRFIRDANFPNI